MNLNRRKEKIYYGEALIFTWGERSSNLDLRFQCNELLLL